MFNMWNRRNFGKDVQVECDVRCWTVSPRLLVFEALFLVIWGVEISTSFPLTTKKNHSSSISQETNIYSIWSHSSSALETIQDFLGFAVVVCLLACLFLCFAWSSKFLRRAPYYLSTMWWASFLPDSDCLRSYHGRIVSRVSTSVLHTEVFLPSLNVLPSPPTQLERVSSTATCDWHKYNQVIIGLRLRWLSTGLKAIEWKPRF